MSVWWSVGLTAAGITGWWLAGSGPRWAPWGWGVAIAVQPFWIAFAILGRQWGFILAGLFYAAVALRNLLRARRPQHGFNSPVWNDTVDDPRAEGTPWGTEEAFRQACQAMAPTLDNHTSSVHNRSPEMDIKLGVPTRHAGYRLGDRRAESTPPAPDPPSGRPVRVELNMDEGLRTMPPALVRPLEGP